MFTQDGDSKYVANILSNMANGGDRSVQVTTVSFSFIFALLISFPLKLGGRGCLFLTFTSDDVPCHKLPPHPDTDYKRISLFFCRRLCTNRRGHMLNCRKICVLK